MYYCVMTIFELKQQLYNQCMQYVQALITDAQAAINSAQQAANQETKSSAGDKYETGRAMMQQETDHHKIRLNQALQLKAALNNVPVTEKTNAQAGTGSIVHTNNGNFYVAVSAGSITANQQTYMAVSSASPVGLKLKGKKAGDEFSLNNRNYKITAVY